MGIKSIKQQGLGGLETTALKAQGNLATGGSVATLNGYRIHTFNSTGTFCALGPLNVEYFIVAGGGSAGSALYHSGGGGGGGVLQGSCFVNAGTYTVTVGAGGTNPTSSTTRGNNGSNSSFNGLTATGGGGGGVYSNTTGLNGGSGGGGGAEGGVFGAAGTGIAGQGYRGGVYDGSVSGTKHGGGGGGAGGAGTAGSNSSGGNGGIGITSMISGTLRYYSGGGGGSTEYSSGVTTGGLGGGGNGNYNTGENGTANTGGGGGGGERISPATSGSGGSGIVIIRYRVNSNAPTLSNPIVTDGLVYSIDADNVASYTTSANIVGAKIYSSFGNVASATRSSNYTVQYSDDNSSWTTAFTGVMSNNANCGIQTGTGTGNGSYGSRRYWRYVEGSAIVNHHPRCSRIMLTDINGIDYVIVKYLDDNKADLGTYQVGTVTLDFSNKIFDVSGDSNTTSVNNGAAYSSLNGGYFSFDATNDSLSASSFYKHQTTTGTIAGWAYPADATNDRYIMGVGGNAVTGTNRAIRVNGGNWSTVSYGSSTEDYNSIVAAQLNTWQYIVFAWNGTSVNFYFNGVQYSTSRSGMVTPTGTQITIGLPAWSGSTSWWSGRIGPIQVYNKTLSQAEVNQNFNALRGKFGI
jgi:hypothetical protein